MEQVTHDELAKELGRELTAEIAPEELAFYDELIAPNEKQLQSTADHALGFGVPEGLVGAVSLLMFSAAKCLVALLWEAAKPSVVKLTEEGAKEASNVLLMSFRRWIRSKLKDEPPIKLSPEQKVQFVNKWVDDGVRLGLTAAELVKLKTALERAVQ